MEQNLKNKSIPGVVYQVFATVIANLLAIADGMTMGWTSPMIPYFMSDETHIHMTKEEAEWLETLILVGSGAALPVTAYLVNKIGRRKSMMFSCFVLFLCWIIIAVADRVEYLFAARFVMGFGLNTAFVSMPMYISEISHKKIRGSLTATVFIFMLVGILIIYSIGPFVPYYVPSIFAMSVLTIEIVTFFFLPESPYHLLMIGQKDKAKAALEWFRGGTDVSDELLELESSNDKMKDEGGQIIDIFVVPNNRRAMFIMLVVNFIQLFGGFEVILMNLHEIMESAGSIYLDSSLIAIAFAVSMLLSSFAASLIVDKFGRKKLLIVSCITTGMCVLALAVYFHLKDLGYDTAPISWIPIASVMSYAACFKFGLGTASIVITAEIFSPRIKNIGMSMADAVYVIASIAALQVFFILKDRYGMYAPFYIFSACLFSILPFFICYLPETKGKSLDEIQETLKVQRCL